ncbi:ImmA/IrrE family metallo-endopeptidase [Corynebacterium antarcticum]|uniref:ImmA/IrrE family metallo-endopeptidase n=1 Tax=Corynebacterium antarcticum TaxID=2800405 RepID=UPI002006268B|nr:ImmA/IrrE family metallo-endopeptidase [Corynebacterium antarcticum]MCK7661997.1 ImmA/IrrE family metallo-endopeptidase [Corynebacterium antarcticum]
MDREIYRLIDELGIRITEHAGGEQGRWYDKPRVISLRKGLNYIERRCTVAHELGHAALGHMSSPPPWLRPRQEREADAFAADLLVSSETYAAAEDLHGNHHGAIASELYVTRHLVDVWQRRWQCRTDDFRTHERL